MAGFTRSKMPFSWLFLVAQELAEYYMDLSSLEGR